jgi:hypothetical protein
MKRAVLVLVVFVCCPITPLAQGTPIELTDKITSLDGLWIRDTAKGVKGSCSGMTTSRVDQTVRISVSTQRVSVESHGLKWLVPLDGSPTTSTGPGVATATLDAGWLAITTRAIAPMGRGTTNVFREVYIASRDELTIWRNFTIEWPDGSLSSTACSYREALVYQRQKQP